MKEFNYTKVYLATEVEEACKMFTRAFASKICYLPQKRYKQTERRFLSEIHNERENDYYLRGKEYLMVLCVLAKCAGLYGSDNGATRLALIINQGHYDNVNIWGGVQQYSIFIHRHVEPIGFAFGETSLHYAPSCKEAA